MNFRFYEVVFSLVPIYHLEDLKENYQKFYGTNDVKAIKESNILTE